MRLAGLFVLVVALVMWVLLASSLLDGLRGGQRASVLTTVTATATPALVETTPTATPVATATAIAVASPTAAAEVRYTVAAGDNLTRIARQFGVTVEALQAANDITDPSTLQAGQVLVIPAP
jgi:LysM repeat protein